MGTITLRQAAAWCGGTVEEKYADVTLSYDFASDVYKFDLLIAIAF